LITVTGRSNASVLLGRGAILLYYFSTSHAYDPLDIGAIKQAYGVGSPQFPQPCGRLYRLLLD